MSGTLYLCATPIGNLKDISARVLETLDAVDLIACEDTRTSKKLLTHYGISTAVTSYHQHNRFDKARVLVDALRQGKDVALMTDAGTPLISDPGEELVALCAEEGIQVTSLPGPSALITALSLSAISARRFVFEGFLPPARGHKKEREKILKRLQREERTILIYEAPHRLGSTLRELALTLGAERRIALCREMTKKFEEVQRMTIGEAAAHYETAEARGEYVLVIEGATLPDPVPAGIAIENAIAGGADSAAAVDAYNGDLRLRDLTGEEALKVLLLQLNVPSHVAFYEARGLNRKEAMKQAASDRGVSKREIYAALLADDEAVW